MSKNRPLISITLPNYNYGAFLAESIEGILRQTYVHWELLITDDGSTDGSQEIIQRYAKSDRRIRPVYFPVNQGAQPAHQNTWRRASGKLVYQYSSDDAVVHPDFFAHAVDALEAQPGAGGFFGVTQMVSTETGAPLGQMGNAPAGYIARELFVSGFIQHRVFVPGISSIWKRSAINEVGGYDTRLGPQADYYINHVIPAKFGVVFSPKIYAKARISEAGASYSSNTRLQEELDRFALCERKMRQQLSTCYHVADAYWDHWRKIKHQELAQRHSAEPSPPVGAGSISSSF